MPTNTPPKSSVFETDHTDHDAVVALIAEGVNAMKPNGDINWQELPINVRPFDVPGGEGTIGYSRAYLIVRRAYLEMYDAGSLVTLPTDPDPVAQQRKQANAVQLLRYPKDGSKGISWGDISIVVGLPESRVRKIFRNGETRKDLGLRIGKGGRFAYGDPTLYLDNRKVEGAEIPVDLVGRPTPEMLLNFRSDATEQDLTRAERANRTKAIKRVILLRNKAADKAVTKPERESLLAKVAELMAKYNLTEDHIRRAA
jgi:uncharacterized protein DUF2786